MSQASHVSPSAVPAHSLGVWLSPRQQKAQTCPVALQLLFDDGKPEHRVIGFDNLIMWRGRLHYIYAGRLAACKLQKWPCVLLCTAMHTGNKCYSQAVFDYSQYHEAAISKLLESKGAAARVAAAACGIVCVQLNWHVVAASQRSSHQYAVTSTDLACRLLGTAACLCCITQICNVGLSCSFTNTAHALCYCDPHALQLGMIAHSSYPLLSYQT